MNFTTFHFNYLNFYSQVNLLKHEYYKLNSQIIKKNNVNISQLANFDRLP